MRGSVEEQSRGEGLTKRMICLVTAVSVGLVSLAASAAKVEVVKVRSDVMGKDVPLSVILPDAYGKDSGRRFPVVYALHGAGGSHENYTLPFMGVRGCADEYGIIVACPDGGKTSWWLDSPVDPKMKYETHVVKEVVPYVDASAGWLSLLGPAFGISVQMITRNGAELIVSAYTTIPTLPLVPGTFSPRF